MSSGGSITQELGIGEIISKTFDLYRRNFVRYFVLFLVVNVASEAVGVLWLSSLSVQSLPPNATPQQAQTWFANTFLPILATLLLFAIVSFAMSTTAQGSTIKMTSEGIEGRDVGLTQAVRFVLPKLPGMWALLIIVGIIVGLGSLLIIPGIILGIMFSLVLPAYLSGNAGVLGSLGRSRELVSHRWLKTFATFLVVIVLTAVGYIVIILVGSLASLPVGFPVGLSLASTGAVVGTITTSLLGALLGPIVPVSTTVYYYSNLARIASPMNTPTTWGQTSSPPPGMKFCPNCGAQLLSDAMFCSRCGAKQPA